MKRTLGKYSPGVILLALLTLLLPTTVYASVTAKASNSSAESFTTVIFSVAPESTTNGSATGVITWTAPANNSNFFAYFVNTGTISVTAFSSTITNVSGNAGNTLDSCPIGTTYSTATLCSDSSTPTTLALIATGPALTVGQWLPIHIKINKIGAVFSAGSTVSRSQIRAGTNTVA